MDTEYGPKEETENLQPKIDSRGGSLVWPLMISLIAFAAGLAPQDASAQFGGGSLPIALPINVESAVIDGSFLRNGVLFGPDYFDGGQIQLDHEKGNRTILGNSWDQTYGPLNLIAGRYTPRFSSFFNGPTAPRAISKAFAPITDLTEDQTWNPDVGAISVTFNFFLNGFTFPGSSINRANFYLRDVETGEEFLIGTSEDGSAQLFIVPGVYDVIYAYQEGGTIPANTHARVLEAVELTQSGSLDVDVPSVNRSFFYYLDGVLFPQNTGLTYARISLENPETGDSILLGNTNSPDFARIMPGTYRVRYEFREGLESIPVNRQALLDDSITIAPSGLTSVDIDVVSHWVEPEFQQNGSPPPTSGLDFGWIWLDRGDGDRFRIGASNSAPDPVRIIEGTYDAYYEYRESQSVTPRNPNTRFVTGRVVDEAGPLVLNFETAVFTLDLTLNGAAFPTSIFESGRIHVIDPQTDTEVYDFSTTSLPFEMRLIQADYDFVYEWREGGDEVPVNRNFAIAAGFSVDASETETFNINTRFISPSFALNGAPFPTDAGNYGEFFLRDASGNETPLGESNLEAPDRVLAESAYAVVYKWRAGEDVPINSEEVVRIVTVPEPSLFSGLMLGSFLLLLSGRKRIES